VLLAIHGKPNALIIVAVHISTPGRPRRRIILPTLRAVLLVFRNLDNHVGSLSDIS